VNQQISCQAGGDVTNRRACAAASCPIASTASASGGVPPRDGAQHRVSGVGADGGRGPQRLGPPRGGT
jgi:hypothetical protein